MMSEKRYGVHDCPNGYYYLRDVTDHSVYVHRNYGKLFSEYEEDIELVSSLLNELADKVDEREATINKLKEENEQLKEERNYFERKKCEYFNKYNKKHLDNIQLKEENEQLREIVNKLEEAIEKRGYGSIDEFW